MDSITGLHFERAEQCDPGTHYVARNQTSQRSEPTTPPTQFQQEINRSFTEDMLIAGWWNWIGFWVHPTLC